MTTQSVEIATSADEPAVVAVMTLAFANDPITRWSWPDPRVYFEQFPRFVRAVGGHPLRHPTAHPLEPSAPAPLRLPPPPRPPGPYGSTRGRDSRRCAPSRPAGRPRSRPGCASRGGADVARRVLLPRGALRDRRRAVAPDGLSLHDLPSHQRGAVRCLVQRAGCAVSVPVG